VSSTQSWPSCATGRASLAIVVNAVYSDPRQTGAGLGVMLAGVPLYLWLTRGTRV